MKGCIVRSTDITIKNIFEDISDIEKYNWLITNIECYPSDKSILKVFENDYCWISGDELSNLFQKEDFQWIWGVFSAFSYEVELKEIFKYKFPFADGYKGFWENPISIQHPFAKMELVVWDGAIILVISEDDKIVESIIRKDNQIEDLEVYNSRK